MSAAGDEREEDVGDILGQALLLPLVADLFDVNYFCR